MRTNDLRMKSIDELKEMLKETEFSIMKAKSKWSMKKEDKYERASAKDAIGENRKLLHNLKINRARILTLLREDELKNGDGKKKQKSRRK